MKESNTLAGTVTNNFLRRVILLNTKRQCHKESNAPRRTRIIMTKSSIIYETESKSFLIQSIIRCWCYFFKFSSLKDLFILSPNKQIIIFYWCEGFLGHPVLYLEHNIWEIPVDCLNKGQLQQWPIVPKLIKIMSNASPQWNFLLILSF